MKNSALQICLTFVLILSLNCHIKAQETTTINKNNGTTTTIKNGKKSVKMKNKYPKIKGTGKIVTEKRKAEKIFNKISASTLLDIEIEQADNFEIVIEADDNIIPYIVTEISSNKLKIYFDEVSITDFKQAKVYVKLPKISELKAASSATIKTNKAIKSDNLKLDASSSGDILLTEIIANSVNIDTSSSGDVKIEKISTKNLDITSSSSGSVKIEYTEVPKIKLSASSAADISIKNGKTTDLNIKASSSADVKTKNLQAVNVSVTASSSADVSVFPITSLVAEASSTATIYYYNQPQNIDKETSSLGTIKQRTK